MVGSVAGEVVKCGGEVVKCGGGGANGCGCDGCNNPV